MNESFAPTPKRKRPRLRRLLLLTRQDRRRTYAVLAGGVVLASYLAVVFAFVWPQNFRNSSPAYVCAATAAFMIRTFLFHLGLLLSAVATILAATRCWRLLIASLPLVIFTVGPALWSYVPRRKPTAGGETITVMSVNLLAQNDVTAPIVAEVVATKPDILLLQEYTPRWHEALRMALAADYPHAGYVLRSDTYGLAIYSRQPFVGPVDTAVPLGAAGTPQARAVVQIGKRNIVLYNVHLMLPKDCSHVLEQRREFADLLDRLTGEESPIILTGDFNFTNASAFADELRRLGLIDAHRISGWGRGSTWPMRGPLRWAPGIRLDHVFLSKGLTSTHSRTGTGRGSDHRPVIAEVGFAR
jgi:endonuclease/exonuclease/phosphatase (EEP) superfamily protein YafD